MADDSLKIPKLHTTEVKAIKTESKETKTGEIEPTEIKVGEELSKMPDSISNVDLGNTSIRIEEQNKKRVEDILADIDFMADIPETDEEISQRKSELEALAKNASKTAAKLQKQIHTDNTWFGLSYNEMASKQAESNEVMNEYKTFITARADMLKNVEHMSAEEYYIKFKELTGMDVLEYRNSEEKQKQDIDLSIAANSAAAKKLESDNSKKSQKEAVDTIRKELNKTELGDYGAVKTAIDSTVVDWFGTSRSDIAEKYNEKSDQLLDLMKSKDNPEEFVSKYKAMTGVTFDPEKIRSAKAKKEEYSKAQATAQGTQKVYDTIKTGSDFLAKADGNISSAVAMSRGYATQDAAEKAYWNTNYDELKSTTLHTASVLSGQSAENVQTALEQQFETVNGKKFSEATREEQVNAYKKVLEAYTSKDKLEKAKGLNEDAQVALKSAEKEYKAAAEEAFGKNELSEMMQKNQAQVEYTYQGLKVAAIIGTTVATGGAAGAMHLGAAAGLAATSTAAGLTSMAVDGTEKSTDSNGLTTEEVKQIGKDGLTTSLFTALGGGANAIGGVAKSGAAKVTSSKVLQRIAGESTELATDATSSFVANKALGNDTTLSSEALQSGLPQLGFMAAGSLGNRLKNTFKTIDNANAPKVLFSDASTYIDANGNKITVMTSSDSISVVKTSQDIEVGTDVAKKSAQKVLKKQTESDRAFARKLRKQELAAKQAKRDAYAWDIKVKEGKKIIEESKAILQDAKVDPKCCKFSFDKDNNIIILNMDQYGSTGKLVVNPDGTKTLIIKSGIIDFSSIREYYPDNKSWKTFKTISSDGTTIRYFNEDGSLKEAHDYGINGKEYLKQKTETTTENSKVQFDKIKNMLKEKPNIQELIETLKLDNRNLTIGDNIITYNYYDIGDGRNYFLTISFDSCGKILGYVKKDSLNDVNYYVYTSKGHSKSIPRTERGKLLDETRSGLNFEKLLGKQSTNLDFAKILQYLGKSREKFSRESIKTLEILVQCEDDAKILNELLEKCTYNPDEMINILKSEKAKTYILEKINSDSDFSKADLNKVDKNLTVRKSSYKLSEKRDLSYKIEDVELKDDTGVLLDTKHVISEFKKNIELKNKVPAGECVKINGTLYVNDGDNLVKLNISKEKFEELFPIKKRHEISQGQLGDCYLISILGALMDSPKGRVSIYKMFSQKGNDILIKFPTEINSIIFKNGKLKKLAPFSVYMDGRKLQIKTGDAHLNGSKGLQMLEEAYAVRCNDGFSTDISDKEIQDIFFMNKQMQELTSGNQKETMGELLSDNCKRIGILDSIKSIEDNIDDPNTVLLFFVMGDKKGNIEYDLHTDHGYHIVSYDKTRRLVGISNPWHNNTVTEIPINDFIDCAFIQAYKIL